MLPGVKCVLSLTRQTEARLVKVAHWLLGKLLLLLLLLLLLSRGSLHRGDGRHHLGSHSHLTHWPVILAPRDSSQLCELYVQAQFIRPSLPSTVRI